MKILLILIAGCAFLPSSSYAFGRSPDLSRNPYIMTLQKEFHQAGKCGVSTPIVVGAQYNCRTFNALTQNNSSTPDSGITMYKFSKFGDLFLDNLDVTETGRIKTYAINPHFNNELLGESDDHTYFEVIRATAEGDLVIEGSASPSVWIKTVLQDLGLTGAIPEWNNEIQGLALASEIFQDGGLVVDYAYCPASNRSPSFLDELK